MFCAHKKWKPIHKKCVIVCPWYFLFTVVNMTRLVGVVILLYAEKYRLKNLNSALKLSMSVICMFSFFYKESIVYRSAVSLHLWCFIILLLPVIIWIHAHSHTHQSLYSVQCNLLDPNALKKFGKIS